MKKGLHQMLRGIVFAFLLTTIHSASAFYDPTIGRWASRDPIGENGFETLRQRQANVIGDGPNLYAFVANSAVNLIDVFGLEIHEVIAWTYIEWPTVTDPMGNVFEGDNHTGGAGSFRTIHRVLVETCGENRGIIPGSEWKDTGVTRLLDPKTGQVLRQRQSLGNSLVASDIVYTGNPCKVVVKLKGNESNPLHSHLGGLIQAPAISYEITITYDTKAGRATFSGSHDGFPSYDFYSNRLIRNWSHVQAGTTPWDLGGGKEISFGGSFSIEKCCCD